MIFAEYSVNFTVETEEHSQRGEAEVILDEVTVSGGRAAVFHLNGEA